MNLLRKKVRWFSSPNEFPMAQWLEPLRAYPSVHPEEGGERKEERGRIEGKPLHYESEGSGAFFLSEWLKLICTLKITISSSSKAITCHISFLAYTLITTKIILSWPSSSLFYGGNNESHRFSSLPAPSLSALLNGTVFFVRPGLSFTNKIDKEYVFD